MRGKVKTEEKAAAPLFIVVTPCRDSSQSCLGHRTVNMKLAQQLATLLFLVSSVSGKPRYGKLVAVEGEEVEIDCDVDVDDDGLIVWKHGARVLFAGTLRIRRDYRMAVLGKK